MLLFILLLLVCSSYPRAETGFYLNYDGIKTVSVYVESFYIITPGGRETVLKNKRFSLSKGFTQTFVAFWDGGKISGVGIKMGRIVYGGEEVPLCSSIAEAHSDFDLLNYNGAMFVSIRFLRQRTCLKPLISLSKQSSPLRGDLLLGVCRDKGILVVLRTDKNVVEASLGKIGHPVDLEVKDEQIYVLSEDPPVVGVVGIFPLRKLDVYPLSVVFSPSRMVLGKGKVFVADGESGYVVILDVDSGRVVSSRRVGFGVYDIAVSGDGGFLALSVPSEQKVYILDGDLERVKSIGVSGLPGGVRLDGTMLYFTNLSTGNVEVYDLKRGELVGSVYSGRKPFYILDTGRKVYVSNMGDGTVSVFDKSQYVRLKRIFIGGHPRRMAFCYSRRWLYVDLGDGRVAVIDGVRDRVEGYIYVGCPLEDLSVLASGGGDGYH